MALGGAAFASIPGPDGRFHGCYAEAGGALRIVDSAEACQARETRITFNQSGPQGPAGEPVNGPVIGATISTIAAIQTLIAQTRTSNKKDEAELKELNVKLDKQKKKLKRLVRCPECVSR